MNEYRIEKNVPIPKRTRKGGIYSSLEAQMQIGDSVLMDERSKSNGLAHHIRKNGNKPIVRKEGDKFRVWKVKK